MTSQVEPKKIVVENSNVQYSTQLPLVRTASVAPIKQEAKINVAQSPGLNVSPPITQEKINLGQDHSLSNSLLTIINEEEGVKIDKNAFNILYVIPLKFVALF